MLRPLIVALSIGLVGTTSCTGRGMFNDGTSASIGTFNRGALRRGRELPWKGDGFVVPALWQGRGARFSTDEMVLAIEAAARRVRREYPGAILGVGDLTRKGGGDQKLHRSHENGRDGDLIFYAVDDAGRPVAPVDAMPRYSPVDLLARAPLPTTGVRFGPFSPRRFDVARNWALVRALLEQPYAQMQYLFCLDGLKRVMLEHARAIGDDPELIDRANALLRQPGDSLPHDDHLHVRIYCTVEDRAFGCLDRGPTRWWKKRWKLLPPPGGPIDTPRAIAKLAGWPFPSVLRRLVP